MFVFDRDLAESDRNGNSDRRLIDSPPRDNASVLSFHHNPGRINNRFELNIATKTELSRFTRYLIVMLLILQTTALVALNGFLYSKITALEAEVSRLSYLDISQGSRDEDEAQEDCNGPALDTSSSHTDLGRHLIQDDHSLPDIPSKKSYDEGRWRTRDERAVETVGHETRARVSRNRKVKNDMKKKIKRLKKRLICQKCKAADGRGRPSQSTDARHLHTEAASSSVKDVAAVLFKGGLPEVLLRDTGTIGPWFYDGEVDAPSSSAGFKLDARNSSVVVLVDGFYFIYAQVYYLTSGGSNSFSITRRRASGQADETLATCSTSGLQKPDLASQEVSCFTASVRRLLPGDILQLTAREMNRRVLFRDGQTYFGLTRMSSESVR